MVKNSLIMGKDEQQRRIRKLMIHAINEAIRVGVMPLTFRHRRMTKEGFAEITVCGKHTLLIWKDTGYDELRFSVWWDYRPDLLPLKNQSNYVCTDLLFPNVNRDRFRFVVGACASFYFDYQHKGILSDRGKEFFAVYIRVSTVGYIDELDEVMPFSYSIAELVRPLHRIATPPMGGRR